MHRWWRRPKSLLSEWFKGDQLEEKSKPLEAIEKINTLKDKALFADWIHLLSEDGIIRVGGRLKRSTYNENLLHTIALPKDAIISKKILKWCHISVGHSDRGATPNQLRSLGFYIICRNSVTRSVFNKSVMCRSFRGKFGTQKMAECPRRRVTDSPHFTYCGVDMFGPFIIK